MIPRDWWVILENGLFPRDTREHLGKNFLGGGGGEGIH